MQMAEREKVLTGLECCINSLYDPCPHHCPYHAECTNRVSFAPLLADSVKLLKELPDIVRCKDCKHFYSEVKNEFTTYIGCNAMHDTWGENWFCADGERREMND